mgnify:CR=1 FL=1
MQGSNSVSSMLRLVYGSIFRQFPIRQACGIHRLRMHMQVKLRPQFLYPELVDMSKAPNSPNKYPDKWPAIMKSVPYADMTDTGTLGNAQVATVEKGKKAVELMLDEMEDCVKNYLEK